MSDCVLAPSSLGSQVVCVQCGDECECYVCTEKETEVNTEQPENDEPPPFWTPDYHGLAKE